MKRLYGMLKVFLFCCIGVFAGSSLYQYVDYTRRPGLYEWQSAPWYTAIVWRGMVRR